MGCEKFQEQISAYIDDELSSEEKVAFNEHLLQCPFCREEYRMTLLLSQDISSLPICETERDFSKEWKNFVVRSEVSTYQPCQRRGPHHRKKKSSPLPWKKVLAIAASLVLIATVGVSGFNWLSEETSRIFNTGYTSSSADEIHSEQKGESENKSSSNQEKVNMNDSEDNASSVESDHGNIAELSESVQDTLKNNTIDVEDGRAEIYLSMASASEVVDYLDSDSGVDVQQYSEETIQCAVSSDYFLTFLEKLYSEKYIQTETYERLSSWDLSEIGDSKIICSLVLNQ